MTSLVVPFRYGSSDSLELRYSLRSIDKFMPEVEDVYLVGDDRPAWFFGVNIPFKQDPKFPSVCNVLSKLKRACEDPRISETFLYGNDDFFLLAPIPEIDYFMRNSPLREGGVHHVGYKLTFEELDRRSAPKPYRDCELHTFVRYEKSRALKLLSEIDIKLPYSFRTLYFNLLGKQLVPLADVKDFSWRLPKGDSFFHSINDSVLGHPEFLKWANAQYPRKSRWEL